MQSIKNEHNFSVIFDMDGVLIDSEPMWHQVEIEIFNSLSVPLTLEMCHQTTGLRIDAAVQHWYQRYPWKTKSLRDVENEIKDSMCRLIIEKGKAKPGAIELVHQLKEKNIPIAICSSSAMKIIYAVCEKLGLNNTFQILQSADDCEFGKPHPAPYLAAAKRLHTLPARCVVIEDSLNGAISAKSARMKVIAVPEEHNLHKTIFDFCDAKFTSLTEIDPDFILSLVK